MDFERILFFLFATVLIYAAARVISVRNSARVRLLWQLVKLCIISSLVPRADGGDHGCGRQREPVGG